jgi:hypothetical protein
MPSDARPVARRSKTKALKALQIPAGQAPQCTLVDPFARSRALHAACGTAEDAIARTVE